MHETTRVDTSGLQRVESPRERFRRWFEGVLVLVGIVAVGWVMGDSIVALVSKGSWLAGVVVAGLAIMAFLWFWWSVWSRRAKLFCGMLIFNDEARRHMRRLARDVAAGKYTPKLEKQEAELYMNPRRVR